MFLQEKCSLQKTFLKKNVFYKEQYRFPYTLLKTKNGCHSYPSSDTHSLYIEINFILLVLQIPSDTP